MADFTSAGWRAGETVSAYLESVTPPGGASGASVASGSASSDGAITFTGLTEGGSYVAVGGTSARRVRFLVPLPEAAQSGSGGGVSYVATDADLPETAEGHPVDLVLEDSAALDSEGNPRATLRYWTGETWQIIGLAGGGTVGGGDGGGGEGDEVPIIIEGSQTLDDLGVGEFDGHRALIRVGAGDDTHTEEMQWLASLGRWVGLEQHEMLRTADTWGMDFHDHPLEDWQDSYCAIDNPIIYGLSARSFLTEDCEASDTTLNIADTSQFAAAGTARMRGQTITYTGKTADTLTGVTGVTDSLPADFTPITQGNAGGWATSTLELGFAGEMYAKGFTLEERLVAYMNGSRDDVAMSLTSFYWNEDLGEFYNSPSTPPSGGLGHGVVITGPASDLVPSEPGNRTSERNFAIVSGEGLWTAWSAATPNKHLLRCKIYGKMNSAGAQDNGEVYGVQLLLRWVGTP